jgi:hypothetical protein
VIFEHDNERRVLFFGDVTPCSVVDAPEDNVRHDHDCENLTSRGNVFSGSTNCEVIS